MVTKVLFVKRSKEIINSSNKERGITRPEYLLFFLELEQPQMTSVGERQKNKDQLM